MPKKPKYPVPSKRFVGGAWVILWRFSPAPGEYRQYTVSTGLNRKKEDELDADIILRQFASALTKNPPDFPVTYSATSGVKRYLADRLGLNATGEWLWDYESVLKQEVVASWALPSLSMLRRLDEFVKEGVERTTPDQAQGFLVKLLQDGLKPARRNRALIMCNRFFKWALRTRRTLENPFAGIKLMKEERSLEIVYCTKGERDRIIALAEATGEKDWLAVPVAFYAGMRREEVYRMQWEDIDFKARIITVPITKTKRLRKIPLNRALGKILKKIPASQRTGPVAPLPDGTGSRNDRANTLIRIVRRLAKQKRSPVPQEHIGWNVFRHTFGSLLAQGGVSLDKISALMGNTPEVCRRHYAHFVPRDRHDEDIDKLW